MDALHITRMNNGIRSIHTPSTFETGRMICKQCAGLEVIAKDNFPRY